MPETPAPATPEPTAETPEAPELGDAGKKAIAAERARADKAEKALKALQADAETRANAELTELERFKKENEELRNGKTTSELEALRFKVALEKGIPASLASRLQGADYDSLVADADSLSALVTPGKPNGSVRADLSQGVKTTTGSQDPAQVFAEHIKSQLGQ